MGPRPTACRGSTRGWRAELLAALAEAGIEAVGEGVYWQTRGPRLETPAEVRLIAAHADVVGMTVASECVVAGELGLRYAALCVVDNLANGVGERELTLAEIERNRAANAAVAPGDAGRGPAGAGVAQLAGWSIRGNAASRASAATAPISPGRSARRTPRTKVWRDPSGAKKLS